MTDPITNQTTSSFTDFIELLKEQNLVKASQLGRSLLKDFNTRQFQQFDDDIEIDFLLHQRSAYIDQILKKTWQNLIPATLQEEASLLAVGGYGRAELHPFSDIDIAIISETYQEHEDVLCVFITFLWDLGFQVGHAIRSFQETIESAKEDVSTATNLLESRWLIGNYDPFQKLQLLWRSKQFWPSKNFFEAKLLEQDNRHSRFNNALYQLEPNVKESPGGLRDIQSMLWVAKRHFGAASLQELVKDSFISNQEFHEIRDSYHYLSKVRFALHKLKNRAEDRLLFDNQQRVAKMFGYSETDEQKAVESFMNIFYQNVRTVAKLNELLLQHFKEEIFNENQDIVTQINPRFRIINNYLDVHQENLFSKNPTALLETFIILENYDGIIKGIRSRTIRLIRSHLYLIDDEFRKDPINKALFIEIFRQPKGVHSAIKRMHSYGILGAYLPAFQKITGLMQFNIFHAYTVDEHTTLVIRHIRRFFVDKFAYEFPTAHQIAKDLCKPEILVLAGLFHDIAKGRGGSHEVLGAEDAKEFGVQHNLSKQDTHLLQWLVLKHLDFSSVAQRKDLSDPTVIQLFADLVETQSNLDYLYLLTVADVLSTSKSVWNAWKNALFLQLYNATSQALDKASTTPKNRKMLALQNKEKSREILIGKGITPQDFQPFWDDFSSTFFFSHQSAREISRITELMFQKDKKSIYIHIESKSKKGASELIIYMPGEDFLFAHYTHLLERLNLNIVEAKTYSGANDLTLALIYFLDHNNNPVTDLDTLEGITTTLRFKLAEKTPNSIPDSILNIAQNRIIRCFDTPVEISFEQINSKLTELSLNAKDIPGLLAKIGQVFKKHNVRVHDAKIHTVGEKAEDVFLVSDMNNKAIRDKKALQLLTDELIKEIGC